MTSCLSDQSFFVLHYKKIYYEFFQVGEVHPINAETKVEQSNGIECLSSKTFNELKDLIKGTRKNIWEYWDIDHYPLFLGSIHIPQKSWLMQKQKFVNLLLQGEESMILTDVFHYGEHNGSA